MNPLFSHSARTGYVADILRNYGDRGRPMQLPQRDDDAFRRGMEFRRKEKQYYASLEQQLQAANDQLAVQREHLRILATANHKFRRNEQANAASGAGRGGGEPGGDGLADVLPAAGDTRQANAAGRKKQVTISSTIAEKDESSVDSGSRAGGNNDDEPKEPRNADGAGQSGHIGEPTTQDGPRGEDTPGPAAGDEVQE